MERVIWPAQRLSGEITVPGDKSLSHRALMLGAIARGTSRIKNLSPGGDVGSTARCLSALGVQIEPSSRDAVAVRGKGLLGLNPPDAPLDAGNSGTTVRLLSGILAGQPFWSTITGDDSLRRRPMERVIEPLKRMGARVTGLGGCAPLRILGGALRGIGYRLPVASAQVKSCLLLAGLSAWGETTVIEPVRTRDHTERLLAAMGADLNRGERTVQVRGGRELNAVDLDLPGDLSAAAFFVAAATLVPGSELLIKNVGVNPTRAGFLRALQDMGGRVDVLDERDAGGEPMADLRARASVELRATEADGELIPQMIDEIPLLAILATQAVGTTVLKGAKELRVKETDRLRAVAAGLRHMGVELEEQPDGLVIPGPQQLKGARVESCGDHRIAMAFAVAGLVADGPTVIEGAEWVDISFPGFFDLWGEIAS